MSANGFGLAAAAIVAQKLGAKFVSLAGWLFVRLAATYTFVFGFNLGLVGVWLGSTCDWLVRAVVLLLVFKQSKWQETIV